MVSIKLIFETKQKFSPQFIELTDQDKKQLEHLVKMHKKLDKRRLLINAGLDVNQHITNFDNQTLLSLATRQE